MLIPHLPDHIVSIFVCNNSFKINIYKLYLFTFLDSFYNTSEVGLVFIALKYQYNSGEQQIITGIIGAKHKDVSPCNNLQNLISA